jgi:hypothetical protein
MLQYAVLQHEERLLYAIPEKISSMKNPTYEETPENISPQKKFQYRSTQISHVQHKKFFY